MTDIIGAVARPRIAAQPLDDGLTIPPVPAGARLVDATHPLAKFQEVGDDPAV